MTPSASPRPPVDPATRRYRALNKSALGLIALCLLLSVFLSLMGTTAPWYPTRCGSLAWFGIPCPLCGLTRGFTAIIFSDIAAAQQWNRLSLPLFGLLVVEVVYRIVALSKGDWHGRLAVVMKRDLQVHAVLVAVYLAYCARFYLAGSQSEWI